MSILLKYSWELIFVDIWQGLLSGPTDVYKELLEFYYGIVKDDKVETLGILNDENLASEEFRQISSIPISEQKCIKVLEGLYETLKNEYSQQLAQEYENNLKRIFEKYNLRYVIMQDCRIGLSIQGMLDSMLLTLRKSVKVDHDRNQTIEIMEENISNLKNTIASAKNCVSDANVLVEGAVIDKANTGKDTLGTALSDCPRDMFAHESLKYALSHLYKFFSDQPNVRHPGKTSQLVKMKAQKQNKQQKSPPEPKRLRDLNVGDAMLSTALAISFASFIRTSDNGKSIIDGEI